MLKWMVVFLLSIASLTWAQAQEESTFSKIDFSFLGFIDGPSLLSPSVYVPLPDGTENLNSPINLRSQTKLGYRVSDSVSVGALLDTTFSHQGVILHDPALSVTRYNLLKFGRFNMTADMRVYYSLELSKISGIQSFQTSSYFFPDSSFSLFVYSFLHYDFISSGIVTQVFPALTYRSSNLLSPGIFMRNTLMLMQGNTQNDLVMGPGMLFTISPTFLVSPAISFHPLNPTLRSASFIAFLQAQIL